MAHSLEELDERLFKHQTWRDAIFCLCEANRIELVAMVFDRCELTLSGCIVATTAEASKEPVHRGFFVAPVLFVNAGCSTRTVASPELVIRGNP
jgi:hypothetical protein